ncbi:ATP-binding protein [Stenotrophomonas sp.]|uniref:sensor histidine kinase n=1 Tax=Stenotrophomonas sp. TaxID=69392 RepID=UPI00289883AB|nr:ATP-binding protein [Stenotrophomonas sp.]
MPEPTPRTRADSTDRPHGLGRRTDAMLRSLLLLVALYHPLLAAWIALRLGSGLDLMVPSMAAAHTLLCVLCLLEHRNGRSLHAAATFLVGEALLLVLAYGYWGLAAQLRVQMVQLVPVLLVAAVLGRRPLAWATAWLCALMTLGGWIDAAGALFRPDRVLQAATDLAVSAFGAVMTAWLLHHSVTGLRESLHEARQRSQELARKRDELQVEMQARERSRDQLVHAMKMDNVGRLASGIAHDFNHLLALVLGYVAKARRSEGAALQDALQGADSATRRASAVSRRLLDFSRLEPGRPQLLDAAATLTAMAPVVQQVFDERVHCEVDTGGVQRLIHFDPAQLESILLSLAVNANQAMPDGGRFSLRLQPPQPDGALVLQLQDTGQGMSESVRARCLEPFFTTKPVGQGTGLGLSVTASLVAAAGGSVQVHSRPGAGTRIELHLASRPLAPLAA